MKKKAKKKLSIEKMAIAKISNLRPINGGIIKESMYDPDGFCDLTTRPPESVGILQCPSRGCDDIFM